MVAEKNVRPRLPSCKFCARLENFFLLSGKIHSRSIVSGTKKTKMSVWQNRQPKKSATCPLLQKTAGIHKALVASFLNYAERLAFFGTCQELVDWQYLAQLEDGVTVMSFRAEVVRRLTEPESGFFTLRTDAEQFIDFVHHNGLVFYGGFMTTVLHNLPFDASSNVDLVCATGIAFADRYAPENRLDLASLFNALFHSMIYVDDTPYEKKAWVLERRRTRRLPHDDYCFMFPVDAQRSAFPGSRALDVAIAFDYDTVQDYVRSTSDFAFTAALWDGAAQFPLCHDWDAVWTKNCRFRIRDITWLHVYHPYAPIFDDDFDPYHSSLNKEEDVLMRITGRRVKWETRGFSAHIVDEDDILEDVDDQERIVAWPSEHGLSVLQRDGYCRWICPNLYCSRSPDTGSLCVASLPCHFSWFVRPPSWEQQDHFSHIQRATKTATQSAKPVRSKAWRRQERARQQTRRPQTHHGYQYT
jgi:hypothetical protein